DASHRQRAEQRGSHSFRDPAEDRPYGFSNHQPESPGREKSDHWAGVEPSDDREFEQPADQPDNTRRDDHAEPGGRRDAGDEVDRESAEEDELTVSKIEDSHHAHDNAHAEHQ